jgi:hypothetical protein
MRDRARLWNSQSYDACSEREEALSLPRVSGILQSFRGIVFREYLTAAIAMNTIKYSSALRILHYLPRRLLMFIYVRLDGSHYLTNEQLREVYLPTSSEDVGVGTTA